MGKTIMFVDDNEQILELYEEMLLSRGHCPITYTNPKKALKDLESGLLVDTAIVDTCLNESKQLERYLRQNINFSNDQFIVKRVVTGIDFMRFINVKYPEIKIISCSGWGEFDLSKILPYGVKILKKPTRYMDFISAIEK